MQPVRRKSTTPGRLRAHHLVGALYGSHLHFRNRDHQCHRRSEQPPLFPRFGSLRHQPSFGLAVGICGHRYTLQIPSGFITPLQVRDSRQREINLVAGIVVSFSAPATGPSASFSAPSCTTDTTGMCSITAELTGHLHHHSLSAALSTAFLLTPASTPLSSLSRRTPQPA